MMRQLLFILIAACLLSACSKEKEPLYQEQGYVFGTLVEISVYGTPEDQAKSGVAAVMQEFQRLHTMLHAWQPSELSNLNTEIANGGSMAVSDETVAILKDATQLAKLSHNMFNPAIGGLVGLWGFHADEFKPVQPDDKEIAKWVDAKPLMSDLTINMGRVESKNPAVQIDLGGYAKGYALDRAVVILHEYGINNALVNIGGNIIALGTHGERAWRVGIQHPRKSGAIASLVLHDGEAIGTSGDYQRYFMIGSVRYCHLINPYTGYPMQAVQEVTVLTHGPHAGVMSDVASKPIFMSGVRGWVKASKLMDVSDTMLIDEQGRVHLTATMQKRLEFTDKNENIMVE